MQLKIKYKSIIAKLSEDELKHLELNIKENGCLDPIKVNKDGVILDGHNRYDICTRNNIEFTTTVLDLGDEDEEKKWIYLNQLGRRNLTKEMFEIYIGKYYKANKQKHGTNRFSREDNLSSLENLKDIAEKFNKNEKAVKRAGKYVEDIESIEDISTGFEEKILNSEIKATKNEITQLANTSKIDTDKAQKIVKKVVEEKKSITAATREVVNDSLEHKDLKPTDKKYNVIYADPPWQYNATLPPLYGDARNHYSTMSIDEICAMSVKDICDDNCVLFLWVTSPMLPEGIKTIEAWGFEYKTSIVWDKVKHNVGSYVSARHEFLLIAGRGKATPTMENKKLYDSVVSIERSQKHSEKPEHFRKLIEELYPNTLKIEMFARNKVEGWDNYGNEI